MGLPLYACKGIQSFNSISTHTLLIKEIRVYNTQDDTALIDLSIKNGDICCLSVCCLNHGSSVTMTGVVVTLWNGSKIVNKLDNGEIGIRRNYAYPLEHGHPPTWQYTYHPVVSTGCEDNS